MKKKIVFFVSFIISTMAIFPMSKNRTISVEGIIKSYGNVPMNFIGIETKNGKKYGIQADEEILKELKKNTGITIELDGTLIKNEKNVLYPNALDDGIIEVHNWNIK